MGSRIGWLGRMLFIPNRWNGRHHVPSGGVGSEGITGAGRVLDVVEIPSWRLGLEFLGEGLHGSFGEGEVPRLWTAAF